ncbi:MAG: helicase [Fibrobacter sp.]|nr:helicase [Fibrobacter sp.]
MSTRFFTNEDKNTLFNKFAGIFENNKDIKFFDALVGYLRASGYFAIRPYLELVPHIRILVGINVDAIISDFQKKGLLFLADGNKTIEEFKKELLLDIQQAGYDKEVESGIFKFVEDIVSRKVELRAHPSKRLHAKIYIFRPEGFNEHKAGAVITGSSNLTEAGLGSSENNRNYEFNVLSHDFDDIQFATSEFEKLWNEGISVLPKDVFEVRDRSYLNPNFTPFEIYIKFLIEYFGESIEYDPNAITDLPSGFKRLSYQIDAVNEGYRYLKKHNGFFLADVVGLGKTIIALLIAKKFFFHNDFPIYRSKTLIIVPPTLKESWVEAVEKIVLDNTEIITNGSLHKIKKPEKYDLIIVDEAHKFRNDTAEAYGQLQRICKSPTSHRISDGVFAPKKVILVSATPLNNRPEDIRNLIYLFQDGKNTTLEIGNLQRFFTGKIKEYREALLDKDIESARKKVKNIYETIRTKVLSDITIRRTRTDLLEHEQYSVDIKKQGVIFPRIERPRKIYYQLDSCLDQLYDRTIAVLADKNWGLTYNRYRAIGFLKSPKKDKYQNADRISIQLASIMKTMLVKRVDSSFYAFTNSLRRFRDATDAMLKMFSKGCIYIAPNLNVNQYILEDREDELIDLISEAQETDPTIEICTPEDFEEGFLTGLEHDFVLLETLCKEWEAVKQDPKLEMFIDKLKHELRDPSISYKGKLVVFSESKETTDYLVSKLEENGFSGILSVHSGNRKDKLPLVRANFDANISLSQQDNSFNILITTEVLSEGINLHRANIIVNYDTPWNSTRLMQRIGRVNRIGTQAPAIFIYNFYPTSKVNNDIELEKKAIMKLQAFHTALGEDSQIYSTDEEYESFGLYDKEVLEERDERLGFLMELRKFRASEPEKFRQIKNMPLRARAGRKDRTKDMTTIVFIRNKRRDAFYFVKPDGALEELSFVEIARAFEARIPEKAIELHQKHHEQVNAAVADFNKKLQAEAIQNRIVDATQGPNEKKALTFLDAFLKIQFVSEKEKSIIQTAKQAIKVTRFQGLQREINKLQRAQAKTPVKPVIIFEKLMEILRKYPLEGGSDPQNNPAITIYTNDDLHPDIIISESFKGGSQ